MPRGRGSWRAGAAVSLAFHSLVVLLVLSPFAADILVPVEQGAGGLGPAGGGGGGTRATGESREALTYVAVVPSPPAATTQAPVPVRTELPEPVAEAPLPSPPVANQEVSALPPVSALGGSGSTGSAGAGPGSGGGVGSGVGTGRGSAAGPGTGGGTQQNYPPTAMEMFIPPLPVPASASGRQLVVQFDVDETGRVRGIEFTPTPDRGYNRRLREVFEGFRFRPGTRPDGTPVRMIYQMELDLP